MANFKPLKRAILFCLKQLIAEHDLHPEFLDIGCGVGDVSAFLAGRGWTGKAIDVSDVALEQARLNLGKFPGVRLGQEDFFDTGGTYGTVLMLDLLEHLPDDAAALRKVASVVRDGGYAVIVVPSNPRRWGWDDEFYGHVRRYTEAEIRAKLHDSGLEPIEVWDFTFPVFTVMRGVYARVAGPRAEARRPSSAGFERTLRSGVVPKWQSAPWVGWLGNASVVWEWVYRTQFRFFRQQIRRGHEMIVLAKKAEREATHG